MWEGGEALV